MKISIQRIDKTLPLPKYQTKGAVAFDLYARQQVMIMPKQIARIPTNLIITIPNGYMLYIQDRSSTAQRKGLLTISGLIDQDYHGPEDEIQMQVYNISDHPVKIEREERIGQAVFVRVEQGEWQEIEKTTNKESRGGFGSTN